MKGIPTVNFLETQNRCCTKIKSASQYPGHVFSRRAVKTSADIFGMLRLGKLGIETEVF